MRIEPKAAPSITSPTGAQSTIQMSARDRAIAMLSSQTPAVNQNSVSPEEVAVAKAPEVKEEVGQNNNIETQSEAPKEATKVAEDPISTQYANLARKEKALRARVMQQEQAIKAKEAAILAKEEAIKAKESEYQSKYISKDRLSQDTLNALAEAGLDYDQITQLMLNQANPEEQKRMQYERKLEAQIEELKKGQLEAKKAAENQQTQAYQQAVAQIKAETKQLVMSNEEFETIKETNSINDVVDLIERTFKADGVLLSVEDAAREVENYLVEEAMKLTSLKKIQQRLSSAKPAEAPKQESTKQPQTLKTLTNAVSSSRKLSSRERAIAAFKGELK